MIDIDTHRVIDLLPSREIEEVAEWLSLFPNLEVVSRDGSVSYNSAIKKANETIIQVSDRFHLLKGLTDAAKRVITSHVTSNIGVPVSASHYEGTETADYWGKETAVVMVHGVFFRDWQYFNYWGRIPKELNRNGCTVYYGKQQSAASVETSARELKERVLSIIEETGSFCGHRHGESIWLRRHPDAAAESTQYDSSLSSLLCSFNLKKRY